MAEEKRTESQPVSENTLTENSVAVENPTIETYPEKDKRTAENSSVEGPQGVDDVEKQIPVESYEEPPKSHDPNVIDWLGPDDPEHPTNWSWKRKGPIVVIVAFITFLTYVYPALCLLVARN